jgi:hypothetical protein
MLGGPLPSPHRCSSAKSPGFPGEIRTGDLPGGMLTAELRPKYAIKVPGICWIENEKYLSFYNFRYHNT